jgi:hypothetical protein
MNINTYEISKSIAFDYCQVPLLENNPCIIEKIQEYIDGLVQDIFCESKKKNKTLKQFLDEENFEDIDLEDVIYNIVIILHGGALDKFLKYDDNISDRFYDFYLNTFDIELGEYIIELIKEENSSSDCESDDSSNDD